MGAGSCRGRSHSRVARSVIAPAADQVIELDSAGALYAYLNGQGALRAFVQGTDDVGHGALAN